MMDWLVVFIVGWIMGSWVGRTLQLLAFRDILKDLGVSQQRLIKLGLDKGLTAEDLNRELKIVEVRLEKMGDQIYAFRKDTDQFLGQGEDREQLIQRLTENLTPCRVIIAEQDGANLLQKRHS